MFNTTTDLMPHQEPAVAKLLPPRVGAMFMDMGTGKSRTLIELAKRRQAKWDRLFWFTPCSLRDNVVGQILEHTDIPEDQICVWDDRTRNQGIPRSSRFHVIGIETMSSSDRAVLAYNDIVGPESYVAVDESAAIKGYRAKRTQRITHISARSRYRTVMDGVPLTQGAVDLYSQMAFLSPKILGYNSFWSFAANHLEYKERLDQRGQICNTDQIIRSHNEDYLAARIAPYTYQVLKDECLDLPDKLYATRYFSMTEAQRELYEQAKDEILSLKYDDWSPIRIFHLFTSLQTIVCGFWRRPNGELIQVEHDRLDLLQSVIREIPDEGEQVVIWAKYRPAVREICDALSATYGADQVCPYFGDLTQCERAAQLERWRSGARFLVGTQSTGGRGLTLVESAHTIFYADSFKYAERRHTEDRTHRIGQTRRPTYTTLRCLRSIDDRIADSHSRKGNVLSEFQTAVNRYRKDRLKQRALELVKSL